MDRLGCSSYRIGVNGVICAINWLLPNVKYDIDIWVANTCIILNTGRSKTYKVLHLDKFSDLIPLIFSSVRSFLL